MSSSENRPKRAPLDAVVESIRAPYTRAGLAPSSLSERAAAILAPAPRDALSLMREVCRLKRLSRDAADRMAEVLLGAREDFVQLDDDRWAYVGETPPADGTDGGRVDSSDTASAEVVRDGASALLNRLAFAVVDVETTGSRAGTSDRVTEIGIVHVDDGCVGERWSALVNPGVPISPFVQSLTGITNAMVASAPPFAAVADEVRTRLEGRVFVAHNASFDWGFVRAELWRSQGRELAGESLCTVRLARRLLPNVPKRSLDRLCVHFGIENHGRHRAGGDAEATAQLLLELIRIAEEAGMSSYRELMRYLRKPAGRRARPSPFPTPVSEDTSA